jgi:methylthioribose-1-phosphate isomerase
MSRSDPTRVAAGRPALPLTVDYAPGVVRLLDQTLLPEAVVVHECSTVDELVDAIVRLRVRGAPAIGVAAAHGAALAADLALGAGCAAQALAEQVDAALAALRRARPTAVNLGWAVDRMRAVLQREAPSALAAAGTAGAPALRDALAREAALIQQEDQRLCRELGAHGAELLPDPCVVMTHCNAGVLATAGIGTALGVIYAAAESGKRVEVIVRETRPLLQGARLTAWELSRNGLPVTLICDDAAGSILRSRRVDAVLVGADRIAANGDVANKIGTYALAVLAARHGVPFYVAAPYSTLDLSLPDGSTIPIEERSPAEVSAHWAQASGSSGVRVANPAFDVTPAELVTAIITERGVLRAPLGEAIRRHYGRLPPSG